MQAIGKTFSSQELTQEVWTEASFGKITQALPTAPPPPTSLLKFPCKSLSFGTFFFARFNAANHVVNIQPEETQA